MSSDSRALGKIAILLPDLRGGGAERLHLNLAREWIRQGLEVDFVLRKSGGELLHSTPEGSRVVDLAANRVRHLVGPLIRYLRTEKPDALLVAMWPLTVVAPMAARWAGFSGRVVISEHSPLSIANAKHGYIHGKVLGLSQRFCYPLADARIAVSGGVARDLAATSGLSPSSFTVVHNPAALGVTSEARAAVPQYSNAQRPFILSVGALKPVKRHDQLIRAFALLPAASRGTLFILGEGSERGDLERLVEELGLSGSVVLPGFVKQTAPWYGQADLFVLSSEYEGFGNVLVEAMEHGLPIVSTDCVSGPAEVLCDGRYGRLVPVGDIQALSDAMKGSIGKEVDRVALAARAREFSVDVIAKRYLDVIFPCDSNEVA